MRIRPQIYANIGENYCRKSLIGLIPGAKDDEESVKL